MVFEQASKWERALIRAQANGVKVRRVCESRHNFDSTIRYEATSTSRPGTMHRVAIHCTATGVEVVCSCEAGQRGHVCQHAAGALKHAGLFSSSEPATVQAPETTNLLGAQANTAPVEEPAPAPRRMEPKAALAFLRGEDDDFNPYGGHAA